MPTTPTSRPELDLTGASCPMAFVKARIYLDQRTDGEITQIQYENTPANEPLIRSIQALGHIVLPAKSKPENKAPEVTDTPIPDTSNENTLQLKCITVQVKK